MNNDQKKIILRKAKATQGISKEEIERRQSEIAKGILNAYQHSISWEGDRYSQHFWPYTIHPIEVDKKPNAIGRIKSWVKIFLLFFRRLTWLKKNPHREADLLFARRK